MPPRASHLQNTLNLNSNNAEQEVTCPLKNQDGSSCRKRCMGEKRYRSMQEHIRRAHPEHYIPKLPATKESFDLMINSPPQDNPVSTVRHNMLTNSMHNSHPDLSGRSSMFSFGAGLDSSFDGYHALGHHDGGYYTTGDTDTNGLYQNIQGQQRASDEYRRGSLIPAAHAAAALASLHYERPDPEWAGNEMAQVIFPTVQLSPTVTEADFLQNFYADQNHDLKQNHFNVDTTLDDSSFLQDHVSFSHSVGQSQAALLASAMNAPASPDRPPLLPPLHRVLSRGQQSRPRKSSFSQQARIAKHERKKSRDLAKRISNDKKMFASEPSQAALFGKRWEDLIDAATSATEEEDSRDLTPMPHSPYQSPRNPTRTSIPPFALGSQFQSYQASPLNRALTPPGADTGGLELQPFASVDSSLSSAISHQHHDSIDSTGSHFQILNPSAVDNDSSPMFGGSHNVQIYCAGCRRLTLLKEAYACTNCISGLCRDCVDAIVSGRNHTRNSACPKCNELDYTFKPFQLDFR